MKVDKRELLDRADELEQTIAKAVAQLHDLRVAVGRADLPDRLERPRFNCGTCGVAVVNERALADHLRNVHGIEAQLVVAS